MISLSGGIYLRGVSAHGAANLRAGVLHPTQPDLLHNSPHLSRALPAKKAIVTKHQAAAAKSGCTLDNTCVLTRELWRIFRQICILFGIVVSGWFVWIFLNISALLTKYI